MNGVIGLALKTTGIEMYGEHFQEGSIPRYWIGASAAFHISRMKFPLGGKNV